MWIEKNGWSGYDPYDIKGSPLFLYFQRQSVKGPSGLHWLKKLLFHLEDFYPLTMRRLFRTKKEINSKTLGLLGTAYLNLFQVTNQTVYKEKALSCLSWLMKHPSPGYETLCWGYPFDWQSKRFIPKGTPSAVVSTVVGGAFWKAFKISGHKRFLEACESICHFLVNHLNIDYLNRDTVCFSYTPLDDFHIHNANLLTAEFLIRIGQELSQSHFLDLGLKAANYALLEQNTDGSLYYWGKVQNHFAPNHIDHYHSGFEIRALHGIGRRTKDVRYLSAYKKYYSFYRDHLFMEVEGLTLPKMTPRRLYPINIHACAEAILCNATLTRELERARHILPALCLWVIKKMQTESGWFIYTIQGSAEKERPIAIPYIRWGQAWMLLALSAYLLAGSSNHSVDKEP
jgi:hypothetical protein